MEINGLFYPKAVAVFGSAGEGKLANILVNSILEGGMDNVCIVNPKGLSVGPAQGYVSLLDVPHDIDMAVIASPAKTVNGIMEDCGKKGVKFAVVISSGFSEAGNHEGEEEVIATAKKYGIRFIGPNCAGMVCTQGKLAPTLETTPPEGNISIISQSGAVGGSFMALAEQNGVGISKFISYGNGGDLTALDLLRYLKEDPDTKVIALYNESIPNGREFMEAIREVSAVKPVVIVKAGRSNAGSRAAMSHTGSMAGADAVTDAALKQCGAIRVETLVDLFDVCKGFTMMPAVEGRNLAIITNSGGPGVMTVDRAEEVKLAIPETSEEIKAQLKEELPAFAGFRNPIDLTVEGTGEQYQKAIELALTEKDAAIVIYVGTPYLKAMPIAEAVVNAAKSSGKPVCAMFQVGSDMEESMAYLRENNVPHFELGEDAATVLSIMAEYEEKRKALAEQWGDEIPYCFEEMEAAGSAFPDGKNSLLEPEAMQLLIDNGVNGKPFVWAKSEEEAVAGAEEIGYPLVIKVVSPDIVHKSDVGGVRVNIKTADEVRDAWNHMAKISEGLDFQGVVVYPLSPMGKEVILGLTQDPTFGPIVAFGMGGIYTEVLKDITFRVAPINKEEAMNMINEIKMAPMLKGVRGEAPCDLDKLADMIANFSQLAIKYPDIKEADINPVFLYEDDAVAVDVRVLK